jgi:hypothetical protein
MCVIFNRIEEGGEERYSRGEPIRAGKTERKYLACGDDKTVLNVLERELSS